MKRYKFGEHARQELILTTKGYRAISASLSRRFVKEFQATLSTIRQFPEIGVQSYGGAQKFHLDVFKYTIVYIVLDDIVHIVAVAPQRKKPGYWKDRLRNKHQ